MRTNRTRTGEAIVKVVWVRVRLNVDVVNLQLQLATTREAAAGRTSTSMVSTSWRSVRWHRAFCLLHPPESHLPHWTIDLCLCI